MMNKIEKKQKHNKRSSIAASLASPLFRQRKVTSKKVYNRKRHKQECVGGWGG